MKYRQHLFLYTLILLMSFSCSKPKANFTLTGTIKGLKKGKVYLQKQNDSMLVKLDSVEIKGQDNFQLNTTLEEPQLLYLSWSKNDLDQQYIPFFAAEGETIINTTMTNFNYDAEIIGSPQQALFDQYNKTIAEFKNQNLELIKSGFMAQKSNDSKAADSIAARTENLLKRQYAYAINFALTNKDSEIAPFLAVYEIPDANTKYLDTIYKALTPTIKNSMYGKILKSALEQSDSTKRQ